MKKEQPGILNWKDYPCNNDSIHNLDVCFTFDKAKKRCVEKKAKEEIDAINSNARWLFSLPVDRNLSDIQIYSFFFSKDSRFPDVLLTKLEVDYGILLNCCFQDYNGLSYTDIIIADEQLQEEYDIIGWQLCIEYCKGKIKIVVDVDKVFIRKVKKGLCWVNVCEACPRQPWRSCMSLRSNNLLFSFNQHQMEKARRDIQIMHWIPLQAHVFLHCCCKPRFENITLFSERG